MRRMRYFHQRAIRDAKRGTFVPTSAFQDILGFAFRALRSALGTRNSKPVTRSFLFLLFLFVVFCHGVHASDTITASPAEVAAAAAAARPGDTVFLQDGIWTDAD